jgi:hypothetical protein
MSSRGMIAALVCCAGLFSQHASVAAQGLFAGTPTEVGALPARKSGSPDIAMPLTYEAIRQETYPGLKPSVLVAASVIRLVGKGFGTKPDGRTVMLKLSTSKSPFNLYVMSWRDDEVRVVLPALLDMEVDAKMAANLEKQLRGSRKIAGPKAQVGIQLDGKWVAKPKDAQLAVVYRDLDGDGHEADDCDDFDARRQPGNPELTDAEGLDEDCNPATRKGIAPPPVEEASDDSEAAEEPAAAAEAPATGEAKAAAPVAPAKPAAPAAPNAVLDKLDAPNF